MLIINADFNTLYILFMTSHFEWQCKFIDIYCRKSLQLKNSTIQYN